MDTIPSLSCPRPDLLVNSEAFLENNYAYCSDESAGRDVDALDLDKMLLNDPFPPSPGQSSHVFESHPRVSASMCPPARFVGPAQSNISPPTAILPALPAPSICSPLPHLPLPQPAASLPQPVPIHVAEKTPPISAPATASQIAYNGHRQRQGSMEEMVPSAQGLTASPADLSSLPVRSLSAPALASLRCQDRLPITQLRHINRPTQTTFRKVSAAAVASTDPNNRTSFNEANLRTTRNYRSSDRAGDDNEKAYCATTAGFRKAVVGLKAVSGALCPDSAFPKSNENCNVVADSEVSTVGVANAVPAGHVDASFGQAVESPSVLVDSLIRPGNSSMGNRYAGSGTDGSACGSRENKAKDEESLGPLLTRRAPRKRAQFKNAKPSNFCHVCTHRPSSGDRLVCSSYSDGTCRKIVCRRCLEKQGIRWDTTVTDTRCTHCRQNCPPRAQCTTYNKVNQAIRVGRIHRKRRRELAREQKKNVVTAAVAAGVGPRGAMMHDVGCAEMRSERMNAQLSNRMASVSKYPSGHTPMDQTQADQTRSLRADQNCSEHALEGSQRELRSPIQMEVSYPMPIVPPMSSPLLLNLPQPTIQQRLQERHSAVSFDLPRVEVRGLSKQLSSPARSRSLQTSPHSRTTLGRTEMQISSPKHMRHPQQAGHLQEHQLRNQMHQRMMANDGQLHSVQAQLLPFVRQHQLEREANVGSVSKQTVRQHTTDAIDEILSSFLGSAVASGTRPGLLAGTRYRTTPPPNRPYTFVPPPHPPPADIDEEHE